MGWRDRARHVVEAADRAGAQLLAGAPPRHPVLLAFAFHHLFEDAEEVGQRDADPYQPIVVREFEVFLEHFLGRGYQFVTTAQIEDGLAPGRRYVLVTVDDGYRSSLRLLSVLRRHNVPATFFISTAHVESGRAFWWDVLFRERTRRGASPAAVLREKLHWLTRPTSEANAHILAEFGRSALSVRQDDTVRPLTTAELRELASDPLVTLGNHTADHAILPLLDEPAVRLQIRACQTSLANITGATPTAIAYPGGRFNPLVVDVARSEGLRLGVTVVPRRNRIPLRPAEALTVGRYCLHGAVPMVERCRSCESPLQLANTVRRLRRAWSA